MPLSERLRDCEAAPWVIEEIKKTEEELDQLKAAMKAIADGQTYCSYTHNKSDLKCRTFAQKALEPQSKFKVENHITGKVYDLTQENMTALIKTVEKLVNENARLREALKAIAVAEGRENYPQELWAALLMDKARGALLEAK